MSTKLTMQQLAVMDEAWSAEYRACPGEVVPMRVVKIDGPRLTPHDVWTDGVSNFLANERPLFATPFDAVQHETNRVRASRR